MPWKPGNHHWIPQKGPWAKQNPNLYEETYKNNTIFLPGQEHQRVQHDEKVYGPIGSVARYDMRHLHNEVEEPSDEYAEDM